MKHILLVSLCAWMVSAPVIAQWTEDFEGNWVTSWHADNGTWTAGTPTTGPGAPYAGGSSAGTNLSGDYPANIDTRWIRHVDFVVPQASLNPRLQFWHWYSFNWTDLGEVQVSTDQGSTWSSISSSYTWSGSGVWTFTSLDLRAWADSTIRVAFRLRAIDDPGHSTTDVGSGWFVDDIALVTGAFAYQPFTDFENEMEDWSAQRGTWQIGNPSSGPGAAYTGLSCAATVLAGNYAPTVDSRLIAPEFTVPPASSNPRLRFWHWYNFSWTDFGDIQISSDRGTTWTTIFSNFTWSGSGVWTKPTIDLSAWGDSTVLIGFRILAYDDPGHSSTDVSNGWYIDEITIDTGQFNFQIPEGFELAIGDWSSERGTWEVGIPTSGPGAAHTDSSCAATVLTGNYAPTVDSRLISPPFIVPSSDQIPGLVFWHWHSFSYHDYGNVQIRTAANPTWTLLTNVYQFINNSSSWTNYYIPLADFGDSTVQVAFFFHADDDPGISSTDVSSGWYIDDLFLDYLSVGSLESTLSRPFIAPNPFSIETGIRITCAAGSEIEITDALGTRLRKDGLLSSISYQWDGRTTSGTEVPPGIYFVTVIAQDGQRYTQRVVKE